MLSTAGRNALASTRVDDKPLLLDGYDCEEPLWHEVLLDGALEPPAPEPNLEDSCTTEEGGEGRGGGAHEVAVAHA